MSNLLIDSYRFADSGPANPGEFATEFDGSADTLFHTDSTGISDGDSMVGSLWFQRTRTGVEETMICTPANTFMVYFDSTDHIVIRATNSGGTEILKTTNATVTDTDWHHLLWSFDLDSTSERQVWLDDVNVGTGTWATYNTSGVIDWTSALYLIGSRFSSTSYFAGSLSEVWIDFGAAWLGIGTESNRRKFITAGGLPEDLGSDGSTPLGSAPEIYLPDGRTQAGTTASFSVLGSPNSVAGPNP